MPSAPPKVAASVTIAMAALASRVAHADPPPSGNDAVARAEARFHAGERLFDDKQYEAACAAFDESERLDPQLGTLLNLAFCQEMIGKTATAWHAYNVGAVWAEQRGQRDRQAWALRRAVDVGRKVPIVLLQVPAGVEGYTIELDGGVVPPSSWGTPLAVDPGEHVVRVSARGRRSDQLVVRVLEGPVTQNVAVPRLAARTDVATASLSIEEPAPEPPPGNGRMTVGLVGMGVGLAALGVGTYFGMHTLSRKSDAEAHCVGTQCDATGVMFQDDAHRSATASTVAFAVGTVSLGLGAWLVLTAHPSTSAVSARVEPLLGPRMAGLGMGGSW